MKKLLLLAKIIVVGILVFLFLDGVEKMFFHQDDIILLWDVVTKFPQSFWETASGHIILFFKPIYFLEWYFFRLHFPYYLAVSIFLHTLVIFTAGKIVFKITKDKFWMMVALLMLVVNANFYEVLWMVSSQMMAISTLFSLFTFLLASTILNKPKTELKSLFFLFVLSLIPGLNWGTGLIIPACFLLVFGWEIKEGSFRLTKVALPLFLSQISLAAIFFLSPRTYAAGVTSPQPLKITDTFEIIRFVFFGVSYSIIGRYLFPLASRLFRLISVGLLFSCFLFSKPIKLIKKAINLNWRIILLGLIVSFGSYFVISLSRFQFGLGQAAAPRYAYLPMMFVVIAFTTSLAKLGLSLKQKKSLLIIVMLYTILSLGAFAQVTAKWTERPKKNRILFNYLQNLKRGDCLKDGFLPWYIVEIDQWTIKDIWPIFSKDFDPFTGASNCVEIKRDITIPWTPIAH